MQVTERASAEDRGVYLAEFRIDGYEVLYSRTSRGDLLHHIVLRAGVAKDRAILRLEAALDRIDPVRPTLRLVTSPLGEGDHVPRPNDVTLEQIAAMYRDADRLTRYLSRRRRAGARGRLHSFQ